MRQLFVSVAPVLTAASTTATPALAATNRQLHFVDLDVQIQGRWRNRVTVA